MHFRVILIAVSEYIMKIFNHDEYETVNRNMEFQWYIAM